MGVRIEQWVKPFNNYMEAAFQRSFLWGEFDCCFFVAGVVEAVTGQDVTTQHVGKYDSEETALEYLLQFGGLAELFDASFLPLGAIKTTALYAKRGDVMLIELPAENGPELMGAVCMGSRIAFFTDTGMKTISLVTANKLTTTVWSFD